MPATPTLTTTHPVHPVPVHYCIEPLQLHAHLFSVTLTIAQPQVLQEVALPVWIPGSYLVREFSKNLQRLSAHQNGSTLPITQLSKHRWRIACDSEHALVLRYEVYALDASVRTAWLDAHRGFFNGTSLCLRAIGHEAREHSLHLSAPPNTSGWQLATALTPVAVDAAGFGTYQASNYDELVDSPVEMGVFWHGQFKVMGATHHVIVTCAAPSMDGERLLRDTQKIVTTAIRFWHGKGKPPMKAYWFFINAVNDGYGGLEHRASTALICNRRDLPRMGEPATSEGYVTLLGLICHEYFHTWNVKRLRPAEFASYDYDQENYTQLLWFFEGFTSYYDDLLLRRAGLIDDITYLKLLGKTAQQVLQAPGSRLQSVAQASFDAWVKYYRMDENTPNATISYYTKGALVALCLDLTLRQCSTHTLDDAMRMLYKRCRGGPMTEADVRHVVNTLAGHSLDSLMDAWVHGTAPLPLEALLGQHGVCVHPEVAQPAQRLGLRVGEGNGLHIKQVLRGGLAEQAGLQAGDEWLGITTGEQSWRVMRLDDVGFYAGNAPHCTALIARDGRLLQLPLQLQPPTQMPSANALPDAPTADTISLRITDPARASTWLAS